LAEWADSLIEGGDGGEASEEPVDGDMGNNTFGGENGNDAPADDLSEDESLTSNNPIGIPEGEDHNPVAGAITRRILMQRQDLLQKFGPVKVMQAIDDVADFVGDTDEIGSSDVSGWIKQVERSLGGVDEGMLDTVKKVGSKVFDKLGGGSEEDLLKDLQKKAGIPSHAQHGKPAMAKQNEKEVDESALQAYLGDKKYGKDGMDALRKAGQEHASEKTMQNIRAKFSDKEKEVEEGFVGNMINKAKGMFTKPGQPAAAPATAAPVVPDAATKARIAAAPQGYDPNTGKPQVAMGLRPGVVKKGGTMDMTKKVVAPAAKPAVAPTKSGNYDGVTGEPISDKAKADVASTAAWKASPEGQAFKAWSAAQRAGTFKGTLRQWQQAQQPTVAEDLDADQKRVGQLGPTEKVKNNNIGKLVGANESAFTTHKGGKVTSKDGVTKHQSGPGTYGGYDDSTHPDSPEEKHANRPGASTGHRTDKIKKHKDVEENFIGMAPQAVAEGQDDLNAIKRLLGK
jgi:hypothetical protein